MNNPCIGCGECCSGYFEYIPVEKEELNDILSDFTEKYDDFIFAMKKVNNSCIAFDDIKKCCTIYENRPNACRSFEIGNDFCLKAVDRIENEMKLRNIKSAIRKYQANKVLQEMKETKNVNEVI